MKKQVTTVINAAGRSVPTEVNGKPVIPYKGVGQHRPEGNKYGPPISTCIDFPDDGSKLIATLKEALIAAGLKDGMTISTHHHFRGSDNSQNPGRSWCRSIQRSGYPNGPLRGQRSLPGAYPQ